MGLKKLFLITVLASAMSVLGCGDDETSGTGGSSATGGSSGTGGSTATGGSSGTGGGGGTGGSTAEAICADCENQSDIALCVTFYNECENDPDVCRAGALAACQII